ncbi:MAG: hypothetical protein V3U53_06020, partial [bacterium]
VFVFVHPKATAHLQRIFFVPLIAGWLFLFFGIVFLIVYIFHWGRWRNRFGDHFAVGVASAVCLWLFAAVAISLKSFTLTSGAWPASASLWNAVFNPSLIPAYLLWAAVSVILAGNVGLIYGLRQKDIMWRVAIVQEAGALTAAAALAGSVACLVWLIVLSFAGNLDGMGTGTPPVYYGAGVAVIAVEMSILLVLTAVRRPRNFGIGLCAIAVVSVVTLVAGVQAVQDKSQGPFLIHNYMYQNEILISEVEKLKGEGLWKPAAWKPGKKETLQDGVLGAFSFRAQCRICHAGWQKAGSPAEMPAFKFEGDALRYLDQISSRHPFFPAFAGSNREKQAVALYIERLLKKSGVSLASRPVITPPPVRAKKEEVKKKTIEAKKNLPPAMEPAPAPQVQKPSEAKARTRQEENAPSSGDAQGSGGTPQAKSPSPPEEVVKPVPETQDGSTSRTPAPAEEENAKVQKQEGEESPSPSGGVSPAQTPAPPAPEEKRSD